jgi:NCS1 family nucleobase:cation symporter-1
MGFSFAFRRPHLVAEGAEEIKGKDIWLDNDDLRPLKLKDRTWNATTYFVFWFSATATVSNWCVSSKSKSKNDLDGGK